MADWSQPEIVLEDLEGRRDLDQLNVELPQLDWVFPAQIGAQPMAAFASAHLPQLPGFELECDAHLACRPAATPGE